MIGDFIEPVVEAVYFLLPAYTAIVVAYFTRKIRFLDFPVSERLFGKNKTVRGIVFGILAAIIVVKIQHYLYVYYWVFRALSMAFYDILDYNMLGFLIGLGAMTGDLVKSFFKRRMRIKEGVDWFPFDQADYVIGAIIFSYPLVRFSAFQVLLLIAIGIILHLTAVSVYRKLGIRKD